MNIVEQKLKTPAIILIVVASLALALNLLGAGLGFIGSNAMNLDGIIADPQMKQLLSTSTGLMGALISVFMAGIAGFIIFGSIKMMKGESYGLAMAAAILACVPCYFNCCFGFPVGIWALIMLLNKDVKAAFESSSTPVSP